MNKIRKPKGCLHILYVHNKTELSGGEISLINLWRNLDRKDFKLFLILPSEGRLSFEAQRLGMDVYILSVPSLSFRNLIKIIKVLFLLARYVREKEIDVIHSYSPRNNILSAIVTRLMRRAVIWHERNMLFGKEKDVSKMFLWLPDVIICNSYAVASRFRKKDVIPDKVKVIYNGVDLKEFNPVFYNKEEIKKSLGLDDRKIVGIVSNLNKRKRVECFIQIAALIKQKRDGVLFMVVGTEFSEGAKGRMGELKNNSLMAGLGDSIIFAGFRENIPEFLACFDVFVHVTLKEACSRAILEAMAMARPVVAVNDGGNPELIEDGVSGILIDPYDINGYVSAIERLLDNEEERKRIGNNARIRAENMFDVSTNTSITAEIYKQLGRRKKPRLSNNTR